MFDIGWGELVVIGIVALIVIGPRELPATLRTIGQGMAKLRRMASEFQGQLNEALREAELDELRRQAEKLSTEMTSTIDNPLEKATSELQSMIETPAAISQAGESPASTPVPEQTAAREKPETPAETASESLSGGGRPA
jgi:sec-independent protein translocase protein TatB